MRATGEGKDGQCPESTQSKHMLSGPGFTREAGQTVMSAMPFIKYMYQWCIETKIYIHTSVVNKEGKKHKIKQII